MEKYWLVYWSMFGKQKNKILFLNFIIRSTGFLKIESIDESFDLTRSTEQVI